MVRAYGIISKDLTVRFVLVYVLLETARRRAISEKTDGLKGGALRDFVTRRFALEEIARAHEAVETGHMARKAILEIG